MWRAGSLVALGIVTNAFLTTWLIGQYWSFFDIGVNAAANSLTLLLILPAIMLGSAVVAGALWWASRRQHEGMRAALGLCGVVLVGVGAFALMRVQVRDYPTPQPQELGAFFRALLGQIRQ